jgi:hypothetical protein
MQFFKTNQSKIQRVRWIKLVNLAIFQDSQNTMPFTKIYRYIKNLNILLEQLKLPTLVISTAALLLTAIAISGYLNIIGAQQLVLKTVFSLQGFAAILIAALLITALMLLIFCMPSYPMIMAVNLFRDNKPPKSSVVPFLLNAILAIFAIELYIIKQYDLETFTGIIVTIIIFLALLILIYKQQYISIWKSKFNEPKLWTIIGFVALTLLSVAFISISLVVVLNVWVLPGGDSFLVSCLVLLSLLLSYFPGIVCIVSSSEGNQIYTTLVAALMSFIPVLFLIINLFPSRITTMAITRTGVISTETSTYQLLKTDLSPSVIEAFFTNEKDVTRFNEKKIFNAYNRFHFGGIYLLCSEKFDIDEKGKDGKKVLKGNCIPFDESDIQPIMMEKFLPPSGKQAEANKKDNPEAP